MILGSISRRNTKPPGSVCAEADEAIAAMARTITILFTQADPSVVMAGLVPAIHVLFLKAGEGTWMPGIEPGMTPEISVCLKLGNAFFTLLADRPADNSQAPYSPLPRLASLPIAVVLMTPASKSTFVLGHLHLLGIEGLSAGDITGLLHLSEEYVELNRQVATKHTTRRGPPHTNLFFYTSTTHHS